MVCIYIYTYISILIYFANVVHKQQCANNKNKKYYHKKKSREKKELYIYIYIYILALHYSGRC